MVRHAAYTARTLVVRLFVHRVPGTYSAYSARTLVVRLFVHRVPGTHSAYSARTLVVRGAFETQCVE